MKELEELGRRAACDPRFAPDDTPGRTPLPDPGQGQRSPRAIAGRSVLVAASALLVAMVVLLAVNRGRASSDGEATRLSDERPVSSVTSTPGSMGSEVERLDLVTYPAGGFGADSRQRGTLQYRDGCTVLDGDLDTFVLIWPAGNDFTADANGNLMVRATSGETFTVGHEVTLPGGIVDIETLNNLDLTGPADTCIEDGAFFMVAPFS